MHKNVFTEQEPKPTQPHIILFILSTLKSNNGKRNDTNTHKPCSLTKLLSFAFFKRVKNWKSTTHHPKDETHSVALWLCYGQTRKSKSVSRYGIEIIVFYTHSCKTIKTAVVSWQSMMQKRLFSWQKKNEKPEQREHAKFDLTGAAWVDCEKIKCIFISSNQHG